MDKWTFEIDGKPYAVQDSEEVPDGYEVILPDGGYNILIPYLDESQDAAFKFQDNADPELAQAIGELILSQTT